MNFYQIPRQHLESLLLFEGTKTEALEKVTRVDSMLNLSNNQKQANIFYIIALFDWLAQKRPFFRIWRGFIEAAQTLNISDLTFNDTEIQFPDDLSTVCLEFPMNNPVKIDDWILRNVIVSFVNIKSDEYKSIIILQETKDVPFDYYYFLEYFAEKNGEVHHFYSFIPISSTRESSIHYHLTGIKSDFCGYDMPSELIKQVHIITALVGLISKGDTELIKPSIISKFADKYNKTGNEEYVQKSKNRGFYGWDIGRDLPTQEQIEKMKESFIGTKCPHYRNGHFAWLACGKERLDRKLTWRKGAFVNENVPQGFYD
jgi:hypothetical protein